MYYGEVSILANISGKYS